MVAWSMDAALKALEALLPYRREELRETLELTDDEVSLWADMSRKMFVPFHDDVISQFEGYGELKEFDWEGYRKKYGNIARLDRILEAEGDSPNNYKLSKQADVLMLFYLFSENEVSRIFEQLGYELSSEDIRRNVDYYAARTSHGSTLSNLVLSAVTSRYDRDSSWKTFCEALESDISDVQGGTTAEGIHLGAMAGNRRPGPARLHRPGDPRGDPVLQPPPAEPAGVAGVRHPLPRHLDGRPGHRHRTVDFATRRQAHGAGQGRGHRQGLFPETRLQAGVRTA